MVRIVLCVVFVSLFIESVFAQSECTTPLNQTGDCIVIQQCPPLVNLLKSVESDRRNETIDLLRKSMCGFQDKNPLVCCPRESSISFETRAPTLIDTNECQTPSQTTGRCIVLNQCPSLFRLFQTGEQLPPETVQFLRQSRCGSETNNTVQVCCPLQSVSQAQSTTPTTERILTTTRRLITLHITTPSPTAVPPAPLFVSNVTRHPNVRLLPTNNCGIDNSRARILGGSNTHIDEFPWIALLSYDSPNGVAFRCGGSLINKRYILTAAHCLNIKSDIKIISVRLGEHDTTTDRDCGFDPSDCNPAVQDIFISETIPHPEYDSKTYQNDIGLIRLRNDVTFSDNVQPICLPIEESNNDNLLSKRVTVAGWGQTANGKSTKLQRYSLSVISNEDCNSVYNRFIQITDNQMCTESTDTLGSCSGDGGDPLMALQGSRNIKFFQYGVVSFGPTVCGIKSRPEVFTRVVNYIDWILQNIRE